MSDQTAAIPRLLDDNWHNTSHAFNRCLVIAVLFLTSGVALFTNPTSDTPRLLWQGGALAAGVALAVAAQQLARRGNVALAGRLLVLLVSAVLVGAVALVPGQATPLLPLAAVPVALAALLLDRRGLLVTVLLLGSLLALAALLPIWMPLPLPALALPVLATPAAGAVCAMLMLLALLALLEPLRNLGTTLTAHIQTSEAARQAADRASAAADAERERAIEQLERQRGQLLMLLHRMNDGIVAADDQGRIIATNAAAQSLWSLVSHEPLEGAHIDVVQDVLLGRSSATHYADVITLPTDPGLIGGYTHMLRNYRERAQAAHVRGELTALLVDEMRNPLTSILTALDLTLGHEHIPDDMDRVLVGARLSGQHLLNLVTMLLEMNQIDQNPAMLRQTPMTLTRLLESGIAQTAPLAQRGAITVTVEYGGDCTVLIDSERMQRAVVNLLEHALRNSPPYSTVQVRTSRPNGSVEVRVAEQGPPLTPRQREALFNRPTSPDERATPSLGLIFSRRIIQAHGGNVWFEETEGIGNTYVFTLPVERLPALPQG